MARGIWNGAISFGLINIPVAVMSAKESDRLHFRMLDKRDNSPIGYKQYNKATGKEVDRKDIVKGYEYEPDQYVILTDEDFVQANPKATKTIDIEDFVDLEDLDILLFEKPYYLIPNKNGEKGYLLLREVLEDTKRAAIAKFVLRSKQHLVAIFPRDEYLVLEMLRFSSEVREVNEAKYLEETDLDKIKISSKERQMATALVEEMTSEWDPDRYKDTYQEDLLKHIERKIKTGDTETGVAVGDSRPTNTNVLDLMPLLKKSLENPKSKSKTKAKKKTSTKSAKKAKKKTPTKRAH